MYQPLFDLRLLPRTQWPDQQADHSPALQSLWWLQYRDSRLRLAQGMDAKGVCVEPGQVRRRAVRGCELARACGLGSRRGGSTAAALQILDGTGGWAVDALTLGYLGAAVTVVERSLPVWALAHDLLLAQPMPNVDLQHADLWQWLAQRQAPAPQFDVVYLDPMFPVRNKSAAPGKRLQYLAGLLDAEQAQTTPDIERWLLDAIPHARHRIVVKRRRTDPPLSVAPTWQIKGRTIRYDVYSPQQI